MRWCLVVIYDDLGTGGGKLGKKSLYFFDNRG